MKKEANDTQSIEKRKRYEPAIPLSKIEDYVKRGPFSVSSQMLNGILRDNAMFLAHHPLDVLIFDFDRELGRLCKYLKVNCERQGYLYYFKSYVND